MISTKQLFLRLFLVIVAFGLMLLSVYYQNGKDASQIIDMLKSMILIVFPIFIICELMMTLIINKKINADYLVNKYRFTILAFYDDMLKKELTDKYVFSYQYYIIRIRWIEYVNQYVKNIFKEIKFLADFEDVIGEKDAIISNFKNGNHTKPQIKKFFKKIKEFSLDKESEWILEQANEYRMCTLFKDTKNSSLDIVAFSISAISLTITLASLFYFKLTLWHIGYFAIPIIIELLSLIWIPKSMVAVERESLQIWSDTLYAVKNSYEKHYEDAITISEYEKKVQLLKNNRKSKRTNKVSVD